MLDIGQKAPDFTLPANGDQTIMLSSLKGKNVVLYFYPKDDTSGCTVEAIDFTSKKAEFESLNTMIIGVSKCSITSHEKFIKKHGLDLILVSDEEGNMLDNYGVWVEKFMYGKKYMGIDRTTFLIDSNGIIQKIWNKVKVPNHVEEVFKAVQEL
jgi:peroxiredoxin Q/BCP